MRIGLLADLDALIRKELAALGHPPASTDNLQEVLYRYLDLWNRLPRRVVWDTRVSKELAAKLGTLDPQIRTGLSRLIAKARAGDDLRPHLHDKITDARYRPDLMFYDWSVFHFHLGVNIDPALGPGLDGHGFVGRTKELLFAITDPHADVMYLLDVRPHEFTEQDLLRIVEENWPHLLRPATTSAVGVEWKPTNAEIGKLRKAGVTTILQTAGGRVIAPLGGGITTAGTSLRVGIQADDILRALEQCRRQLLERRAELEPYFATKHGIAWDDLDTRLVQVRPALVVQEIRSKEIVCRS